MTNAGLGSGIYWFHAAQQYYYYYFTTMPSSKLRRNAIAAIGIDANHYGAQVIRIGCGFSDRLYTGTN